MIFATFGLLISASGIHAEEIADTSAAPAAMYASLPRCIEDKTSLETVRNSLKASAKSEHKYDGYRKVLSSAGDLELLARLVYAETLAANCPAQNIPVAERIASVIGNRIRARKGEVRSVVFQRDQFASSLNIYSESRFKDFLCPKDANLWSHIANRVMRGAGKSVTAPDSFNYFLYRHSPRWTKEPWNYTEDQQGVTSPIRDCLRTFRVPGWR